MDLAKAFDIFNHDFLIAKLHAHGFSRVFKTNKKLLK